MFTSEEWEVIKAKLAKASPKLLLVLATLLIGYSSGWHMKGSDVVMDCKYSNTFRFDAQAFNCTRKI
jgi:hypothetical protein